MQPQSYEIPRCSNLDGSTLQIVPKYTEAGQFNEANCITITDGERTAVYVPLTAEKATLDTSPGNLDYHVIDAGLRLGVPLAGEPRATLKNG